MAATGRDALAQSAMVDREIAISRIISAPRELVFEAFTEVRHLSRWWGPEGFTTTTRAFEFRVGGEWVFVMHGPDGTDYREWISWTEIAPPERIALLHGESRGDPGRDAHGVPHQGAARRGGREVPRDRGRPADPEQAGCLRHRDRSERELRTDGRKGVLQRDDVARRVHGAGGRARRGRLLARRSERPEGPALDEEVVGAAGAQIMAGPKRRLSVRMFAFSELEARDGYCDPSV